MADGARDSLFLAACGVRSVGGRIHRFPRPSKYRPQSLADDLHRTPSDDKGSWLAPHVDAFAHRLPGPFEQSLFAGPDATSRARQTRRRANARRAFPNDRRTYLGHEPLHGIACRPKAVDQTTQAQSAVPTTATHHASSNRPTASTSPPPVV